MYVALLVILILVAIIAMLSLLSLSAYKKKRILPEIDSDICVIEEYFRYLSAITLGAASDESAKEYCKAKSIWDSATTPEEALAAFQISDGVSRIILDDARDRFDRDAYREIERGYIYRKNNLLWAIYRRLKLRDSSDKQNWEDIKKEINESKNRLLVRFYHRIKPYPRPWETE